jgi:hypothetical protein
MGGPTRTILGLTLFCDGTYKGGTDQLHKIGTRVIKDLCISPEAGQNIAKPGSTRRTKPRPPARKYAMPVATASLTFTTGCLFAEREFFHWHLRW